MDNRLLQGIGRAGDVCSAGGGAEEGCNNTLTIDIMEREIGIEIANPAQKKMFLEDNCDAVEEKGYLKPYTPEELQGHKERLANISIEIAEIEAEMKQVMADYKGKLKPLKEERVIMVSNIKSKAEYVKENCYRFTDQETRETGYYNSDGMLVESRMATANELHPTIFGQLRTGTDN